MMVLTLLVGAVSAAIAADRFYVGAANIEPGETRTLAFNLENSQQFFGFQADVILPSGLTFTVNNGKPECSLSSRAANGFQIVDNLISDTYLRVGAFSATHAAITGDSGALLYVNVKADDSFSGGTLAVTNIHFSDANDADVELPDFTLELGTTHNDSFYIPDFKIAVGETRTLSVILDNESQFTAFQTDLYLPEGLEITSESSFQLTDRAAAGHSVSVKSFADGRIRIACMSGSNAAFTGNSGALLQFDVLAAPDIAESCMISLKNQIFATSGAKEYQLGNTETSVATERAYVESITLTPESATMVNGATRQITATVLPTFASTKELIWSSSDDAVATVSATGLVTALTPGTTTITAAAIDGSGVKATCEVTVNGIPVESITLNRTTATLKATETLQLSAVVTPANAFDKSLTWTSSNESVATVSADGLVTAIAIGDATITATSVSDPAVSAECAVSVVPTPVTSIALNLESVSLKKGETAMLTTEVIPATATNKDIVWSSLDENIATVSATGKITAMALGETYVVATAADSNGASARCHVAVVPTPVESVTIETPASTHFKVGETIQLTATVSPDDATDKTVTWRSANDAIVTVQPDGTVTAVSVGEVVITAHCGTKTASITLTVDPTLAESVSVMPEKLSLQVGETAALKVSVLPATVTDPAVTWSSDNQTVATVDSEGNITAVALGSATIKATTTDGSALEATCQVTVVETPVGSVVITNSGQTTLRVGNTAQLSAKVLPENATDKTVKWSSQNEAVVTVDANGLVTATGLGKASVIAEAANGAFASVDFTVVSTPVESITLSAANKYIKTGETTTVSATVLPADATNKAVVWTSENEAVASVNAEGVVTANSIGYTPIIATAADGSGVSGSITIVVVPTEVESIEVSANGSTTLKDGETVALFANILPANATDKSVTWSSDNKSKATVDANGLVTAHASLGQVRITATAANGVSGSIILTIAETLPERVEVTGTLDDVTIISDKADLTLYDVIALSATVYPATATNKHLTWSVSDANILRLDATEFYTSVSANNPGTAYIYATTDNGIVGSFEVNVKGSKVERITLNAESLRLERLTDTFQFTATVYPEDAVMNLVSWTSSDPSVAEIGMFSGLLQARNYGKTTITCKALENDQITATCEVEIAPYLVTDLSLNEHSISLTEGQTFQLEAELKPLTATTKDVTWTSSDNAVATVDANGLVTAVAAGEATITVATTDGSGVTDQCAVTVKKASGIATVSADDITISTEGRRIIVAGLPAGTGAALIATDGKTLGNRISDGTTVTFDVDTAGIYVIRTAGRSYKVTL